MLADFEGGIEAWRKSFRWVTIVGIVGDLRHNGLEREANAEVFVPIAQGGGEAASTSFYLVARTTTDPLQHAGAIQSAIHSVDPNQPLADIRSMDARMAESLARRRFTLILLGAFGVIAVALALVGLYGVMAYAVMQRRKEMGIRAALGAEPRDLFTLVVGQGMRLAVAGIALGLVVTASVSRVMASLLFEVSAVHPAMYALMAALLMSSAVLACWLPSRRAARVDPIATLRES